MKPYIPDALPIDGLDYARLIGPAGRAARALGRFDGALQGIPNPAVLLSPLTMQEAQLSSQIEGTQATLSEVLQYDAGAQLSPERAKDSQEILNYRKALRHGEEALKHRPLSLGVLREMHAILMKSVRGQDKRPGEFRLHQNWIGSPGTPIEKATFVPPSPLQLLDHMEAWERHLGVDNGDCLVQTAVIHAQFELMHPFEDGNGRIGRLLIPLFLYQKSALSRPMFYLSGYLETNRDQYIARLQGISKTGDWNGWVEFFLHAVLAQANENLGKVRAISDLYGAMKKRIQEATRSQYTAQALDAIFERPVFKASDFIDRIGATRPTGSAILRQLEAIGSLKTLAPAQGRIAAIMGFPELINLAEGRQIV